jgi:hypothetical protein
MNHAYVPHFFFYGLDCRHLCHEREPDRTRQFVQFRNAATDGVGVWGPIVSTSIATV